MTTDGLSFAAQLREDWVTHNRRTFHPGFHAVAVHRLGACSASQPPPLRQLGKVVYTLLNNFLIRNVYGMELWHTTPMGRRVQIGHHMGVVLGAAVIGDDVLIRQQVTLGSSTDGGVGPRIGNGVELGAGAIVVGEVTIGDGARIGPGTVVVTDVPAGAVAFAPSTRVLRAPAGDPPASPPAS